MRKLSQCDRILEWLEDDNPITQENCDWMKPKIKRLAARVGELNERFEKDGSGRRIVSKLVETPGGAWVAEYTLYCPPKGQAVMFAPEKKGRPE